MRRHSLYPLMVLALLLIAWPTAQAQFERLGGRRARQALLAPAAAPAAPAAPAAAEDDEDPASRLAEQRFPGGAALKTDPEQQRLLKRADQCVEDGRLDLAAILWQKVLDEAGDTLMSRDGRTYTSLSEHVEQRLAKLPPIALDTYRTTADGEAQALLAAAGPSGEEQALADVVRRFFLSSIGDDAAYKLACLALDRHDFVGASRMLTRILERHPDPSIPESEILLRLAVAAAHMADKQAADQALAQLETVGGGPRPASEVVDLVREDVQDASRQSAAVAGTAAKDWHMALGNPQRTGHMVGLPAAAISRTLSELWVHESPLGMAGPMVQSPYGGMMFGGGIVVIEDGAFGGRILGAPGFAMAGGNPQQVQPVSREDLIAQWREGGWRPTGELLFDGGRVYLKTPERVVSYSSTAYSDRPVWQSAWINRYEPDRMSQMLSMMMGAFRGSMPQASTKPASPAELLLFGDRVHQSMSIDGGVLYAIEGKRVAEGEAQKPAAATRGFQYGVMPRRTRSNWLSAYQASGGKAIWTRAASEEDKEESTDVGFLSTPVPCGSVLLVPLTDGGTIWLHGLDRATGKTLWKSHLCDEPAGGASPWAEVKLAVDGREAYLTVGCGVVFAVDAGSGTLRWAVRYQRDGRPNAAMRQIYGGTQNALLDLSGWDDDVVIPHGKALVVMSSDSDKVFALDRRTGEFLWDSPRTPPGSNEASYCLGVYGSLLFVGGKNVVRCLNLRRDGAMQWEAKIEDSFGRGCVTSDAVYVPVRDSILKLELERGRELAQVGVALTSDEPVGNLFSDGDKLWVVGAGRVYAMTTLEHRMRMLEGEIAAGNAEAQLNRMRLYFKQNKSGPALDDLRGAYALFQQQLSPDEAAQRLFAAVDEQKLTQTEPVVALDLLTGLFVRGDSPPALGKEAAARRADVLASAISTIRQQKPTGAIAATLAAAPLLSEEHLVNAAAFAVDAAATKDDAATLIGALERGDAAARLVAIRAATRLAPDDAIAPLSRLLAGGDGRVRLVAARSLANLGQRQNVLETFVALLTSEDRAVRNRSHQSLQALTGQQIPYVPEGKPEERAASIARWKQWVATSGASAKWTLPLADHAVPLGRTLYVSQQQQMLYELNADHTERWKVQLPGQAWGCQGLPNGHRLVSVYSHSMVIEYDDQGREVWRKDRLPGPPFGIQRLDNGNTLVACSHANKIVEIAPDKSTTEITVHGQPMSVQRLDSGNTLVALQAESRVVEIDRSGKVVWEAKTGNPPSHAQRLENGNTLVTLQYGRKVVEYDPTGMKVVWQSRVSLYNPYCAQRLASGSTLVADQQGLKEISEDGKSIRWQLRQAVVTGVSSF